MKNIYHSCKKSGYIKREYMFWVSIPGREKICQVRSLRSTQIIFTYYFCFIWQLVDKLIPSPETPENWDGKACMVLLRVLILCRVHIVLIFFLSDGYETLYLFLACLSRKPLAFKFEVHKWLDIYIEIKNFSSIKDTSNSLESMNVYLTKILFMVCRASPKQCWVIIPNFACF